ncbi:hypothetical protein G7068_15970 [Leucobacter viscericola]|uniref:Uncharacterized protein n=1 Tax=Leucobacter viscericola TaxID=2714935 RepID=A0A6G7XJ17_9MICO|nr:hypothetical protein [Leucobacter viscericola]QIK64543.1 hypothetical protein G7068_15970 [Leucobacter viscericola]
MSNNTYWGTVPDQVEIIEPGEFEDNNGTTNDQPAIWMGEALIEGDLEVWKSFAYDLIEKINTIENRLHFGRDVAPGERAELNELYRKMEAAREGDPDDGNDDELQSKDDFIEALMRYAGIED